MKKPKFLRQNAKNLKRLKMKWRRPRGIHSKLRIHKKSRGNIPQPGYSSSKTTRRKHPSGLNEVLVFNVGELNGLDPKTQCCRIGSSVGRKKRISILKMAKEKNIKILNPQRTEEKKKPEKKIPKEEPKKEETKEGEK